MRRAAENFLGKRKTLRQRGSVPLAPVGDPKAVTKEWLDESREGFDARPADIYSEKGYTVVNVHPWTVNMEALDYFVSRLDKHIKIVTAGELVSLVKEYVRKK